MEAITARNPLVEERDPALENLRKLRELFPSVVSEGRIDVDALRSLVGEPIEKATERYGLSWHGKAAARQLAFTPSAGTLRPCREASVDWDTTGNLVVEGDNLEVLKILHRSYAGRVKMIYIDPPYNTGNDFVYPDDFRDNIRNYKEITGQKKPYSVAMALRVFFEYFLPA